jgi:hypothetical protein
MCASEKAAVKNSHRIRGEQGYKGELRSNLRRLLFLGQLTCFDRHIQPLRQAPISSSIGMTPLCAAHQPLRAFLLLLALLESENAKGLRRQADVRLEGRQRQVCCSAHGLRVVVRQFCHTSVERRHRVRLWSTSPEIDLWTT